MIKDSGTAFKLGRYLLGATCATLLLATAAMAAPITFTDVHDVPGSGVTLSSSNPVYTFSHNIVLPAGDPEGDAFSALTDALSTATLTLNFEDNECDPSFFCWFGQTETISLALDGNNLPSFEVDSGNVSFGVNLALLAADGILNVTVTRISGDVRFDESTLVASGNRSAAPLTPPTAVPEPGSLILLGSGILALGMFGRKRFKR